MAAYLVVSGDLGLKLLNPGDTGEGKQWRVIITIIIIFIYCNWVVIRWQWLFYIYTKYEIGNY